MAEESIKLNNLDSRIKLINDDMKKLDQYFEANFFDVIVSNPPYFKIEELSKKNEDEHKTIARHEEKITLSELIKIARKYLKNNGVFAMVHRSDRLIEIIEEMRKNNIEPKKIQLIHPKRNTNSNMVLIEGKKNGNPGLIIKEPLFIHDETGEYLDEINKLFFRR
jgi:tRNA1(Val) A37 N6-methylase TrmN6